jgi:hypothetical protein
MVASMNAAAHIRLPAIWLAIALAGAARAGDARCWIDNGAVVVPAAYGPIAGDFILDLSQSTSQLHETAARTAGSTNDAVSWTLRLAGRTRRGFRMRVADLDARAARFPTNIAGILGADVLGGSTLDLDLQPCRLRLTLRPAPPKTHDLRTRTVAGVPAVFAAISDGIVARTGWFAIDTASAGSRLADAGLSRPLPKGIDAGDRAAPPARLRAVSVGGKLVEQTPAGLMNPSAPGLAGSLGLSIWSRIHLRLDARSLSARP